MDKDKEPSLKKQLDQNTPSEKAPQGTTTKKTTKKVMFTTSSNLNNSTEGPLTLNDAIDSPLTSSSNITQPLSRISIEDTTDNNNNNEETADTQKWFLMHNPKALINLSNTMVPDIVGKLLSLGPKFLIKNDEPDVIQATIDATKLIEQKIIYNYKKNAISDVSQCIEKFFNKPKHCTKTQALICRAVEETKDFLFNNKHIMVTKADKGNITVLIDRKSYTNKMIDHLNDTSTYAQLKISNIKAMIKRNLILLEKMAMYQVITKPMAKMIYATETQRAKIYGLIKIHKENYPPRPIVASNATPGTFIATKIKNILEKAMKTQRYRVKNSLDLKQQISKLHVPSSHKLFTLDVVSMFTNITPEYTVKCIEGNMWPLIRGETNIPKHLFIDLIQFITKHNTEFVFDNKFYKQIRGLAMGIKTSPILAEIVMNNIFDEMFETLDRPIFIKKYVDDIVIIATPAHMSEMLDFLKTHESNLSYTLNGEENEKVNYLDMTLIRKNTKIHTKWYQKPYSSSRILNYFSYHQDDTIYNTAMNQVATMFQVTDALYHEEIEATAREILKINGFPSHKSIEIIKRAKTYKPSPKENENKSFGGMINNKTLIKEVNSSLKKYNKNLVITGKSNGQSLFDNFFNSGKEPNEKKLESNYVLEIHCSQCDFKYIATIIKPLITMEIEGINDSDNRHPFFKIADHLRNMKHINHYSTTLYKGSTAEETRMASCIHHHLQNLYPQNEIRNHVDTKFLKTIEKVIKQKKDTIEEKVAETAKTGTKPFCNDSGEWLSNCDMANIMDESF